MGLTVPWHTLLFFTLFSFLIRLPPFYCDIQVCLPRTFPIPVGPGWRNSPVQPQEKQQDSTLEHRGVVAMPSAL